MDEVPDKEVVAVVAVVMKPSPQTMLQVSQNDYLTLTAILASKLMQ